MCRQTDRQTDTPQPSRYSLLLLLTLFSHFLLLLPPLSLFLYYNCFLNCDGSPVIKCSKPLDSGGSIDLIWNSSLLEQQQRLPPPPPIFLLLSSRGPRPFESFYWPCLGLRWSWLAFFSFGVLVVWEELCAVVFVMHGRLVMDVVILFSFSFFSFFNTKESKTPV